MDARNFDVTETLKNGVNVQIRAVRSTDKAGILKAFALLDPESIYTRFFQHKQALSNEDLKVATEVDFKNVVALVVTTISEGNEVIIGGGRYLISNPSGLQRSAEIAFLIEEDFHGQGIAGRILKHLAHIARDKGISQFEAEVLPQNKAMLAVFSHSGLPMEQTAADGVIHVTLSLNN